MKLSKTVQLFLVMLSIFRYKKKKEEEKENQTPDFIVSGKN